jgi:hypothetical protein
LDDEAGVPVNFIVSASRHSTLGLRRPLEVAAESRPLFLRFHEGLNVCSWQERTVDIDSSKFVH